jgi:hypothetical protein
MMFFAISRPVLLSTSAEWPERSKRVLYSLRAFELLQINRGSRPCPRPRQTHTIDTRSMVVQLLLRGDIQPSAAFVGVVHVCVLEEEYVADEV